MQLTCKPPRLSQGLELIGCSYLGELASNIAVLGGHSQHAMGQVALWNTSFQQEAPQDEDLELRRSYIQTPPRTVKAVPLSIHF